jgi:hypothetical protein
MEETLVPHLPGSRVILRSVEIVSDIGMLAEKEVIQ